MPSYTARISDVVQMCYGQMNSPSSVEDLISAARRKKGKSLEQRRANYTYRKLLSHDITPYQATTKNDSSNEKDENELMAHENVSVFTTAIMDKNDDPHL
ncbi:unnamed protein product [Didymodactylos carnosus]|uniref:Uncharacterized protein n=2 Tax=Didymodactylos carnosus TaxID=1234261 RepID=A0A8S2QA78_9BILA|nr:unnamed protein product [Didymodactylos carnosus]CAF4092648.1 unnamed protein product [Didymodactylos carnosus]